VASHSQNGFSAIETVSPYKYYYLTGMKIEAKQNIKAKLNTDGYNGTLLGEHRHMEGDHVCPLKSYGKAICFIGSKWLYRACPRQMGEDVSSVQFGIPCFMLSYGLLHYCYLYPGTSFQLAS